MSRILRKLREYKKDLHNTRKDELKFYEIFNSLSIDQQRSFAIKNYNSLPVELQAMYMYLVD